ncbi:hypothetical protein BRC83_00895 [Halobacteriales archaeon QS_1_68_17]|nr:MAG: hypothetical protein BRC83_00895 [Halobacteriales archaeon QS_1_68_17]
MTDPSYRCDGCGATLRAVDELTVESGVAGRSWFCGYCGTSVDSVVAEKLSHVEDGTATDRRP